MFEPRHVTDGTGVMHSPTHSTGVVRAEDSIRRRRSSTHDIFCFVETKLWGVLSPDVPSRCRENFNYKIDWLTSPTSY